MSKAVDILRKHVASYQVLSPHRQNCLDVCDELIELEAALGVCNQFVIEVAHAMQSGPSWYTQGESGLRKQVYMWIDRARKAIAAVEEDDE